MDNADAFQDLKEYLSEQGIGFREIYGSEQMTLQFTKLEWRKFTTEGTEFFFY